MNFAVWPRALIATLLAAGLTAHPPAGANAQSGDPGVAFVSTLNGNVTVQRGDSGDVEAAGINAPLMVGDYVSTAPDARAEVQFDYGHVVRVGPNSQLRFAQLRSNDDTVQLAAGTVGVGVLHATSQYTQVETPSVTIRPREAGFYRVSIDANGTTAITVRSGNAAVLLPQGRRWLDPGSTMLVWGPADHPSYRYVGMARRDPFDQWNTDRNAAFQRANAYQYAAPNIPGLYGLSGYGQWQNSQYGNEWMPNVPAGWTPYSSGQWTYEPYYGWTWVDNAPWGYAPSHYGRWHRDNDRNRWAWTPGPRTQYQSWSPALVAFISIGGVGISIAATNTIGWVPLAPNEQPHPWWGAAAQSYAAAPVTNVQTAYGNARWPNAVRGLPQQSFASGQYQHIAPVAPAYLTHAVVVRAAVPVVPEPRSLRFTQAAAVTAHAPSVAAFHRFTAAPVAPQSFTQQRNQAATVVQQAHIAPVRAPQPAMVQAHPVTPALQPQHPQTVVQPVHPQPALGQHPQTVVQPVHPQPALQQHPVTVVQPVHPQPALQQHPVTVVQPVHPQPALQQHPVTVVQPVHPQPALQQHPVTVVQPVHPQPALQQHPVTVVQPVHPQPALQQQHPVTVVQPVHPQPALQQHPVTVVQPVHPQPALQQRPVTVVQPIHPPPAAVQPHPLTIAQPAHPQPPAPALQPHPQTVAQPVHPQPVVQQHPVAATPAVVSRHVPAAPKATPAAEPPK